MIKFPSNLRTARRQTSWSAFRRRSLEQSWRLPKAIYISETYFEGLPDSDEWGEMKKYRRKGSTSGSILMPRWPGLSQLCQHGWLVTHIKPRFIRSLWSELWLMYSLFYGPNMMNVSNTFPNWNNLIYGGFVCLRWTIIFWHGFTSLILTLNNGRYKSSQVRPWITSNSGANENLQELVNQRFAILFMCLNSWSSLEDRSQSLGC